MVEAKDLEKFVLPSVGLDNNRLPKEPGKAADLTLQGILKCLATPRIATPTITALAERVQILLKGPAGDHQTVTHKNPPHSETLLRGDGYVAVATGALPTTELRVDKYGKTYRPRLVLPEDLWAQTRDDPFQPVFSLIHPMYVAFLCAQGNYPHTKLTFAEVGHRVDDLQMHLADHWHLSKEVLAGFTAGRKLLGIKENYPHGHITPTGARILLRPPAPDFIEEMAMAYPSVVPSTLKDVHIPRKIKVDDLKKFPHMPYKATKKSSSN